MNSAISLVDEAATNPYDVGEPTWWVKPSVEGQPDEIQLFIEPTIFALPQNPDLPGTRVEGEKPEGLDVEIHAVTFLVEVGNFDATEVGNFVAIEDDSPAESVAPSRKRKRSLLPTNDSPAVVKKAKRRKPAGHVSARLTSGEVVDIPKLLLLKLLRKKCAKVRTPFTSARLSDALRRIEGNPKKSKQAVVKSAPDCSTALICVRAAERPRTTNKKKAAVSLAEQLDKLASKCRDEPSSKPVTLKVNGGPNSNIPIMIKIMKTGESAKKTMSLSSALSKISSNVPSFDVSRRKT